MKRISALILALCLLAGCSAKAPTEQMQDATPTTVPTETKVEEIVIPEDIEKGENAYASRFNTVTEIVIADTGVSVDGAGETAEVFTSGDIIYYEDKVTYESGNPYGEGEEWERHTQEEAAAHTVVNITAPGAYRVSGKLSKGQIRIDLGENAYEDPDAVVELILTDADITCTVAPAILFLNVYECDGDWSVDTAKPDVDTSAAGANLVLEGENSVTGSHVAKIFKDNEDEKKLWKQDGAIYSYMSMNVMGPGKLDVTADNEGLDTELHLTINGGDIAIRSDNDGINTNEDGVSVTTINEGNIHIIAGLGAEGDGIDSNGYLVINGGTVVASANPGADAGMDSDLGSFINGGTVIALGSAMDWAESDSEQVTMNLQFAQNQSSDAAVVVTKTDGTVIFAYDPGSDEVLADNKRVYSGAVISCSNFQVGESYHVFVDGELTGEDVGGMYDASSVTVHTGGIQMVYTGTDVMMRPGGMGFGGMEPPADFDPNRIPQMGQRPEKPEGEMPAMPEGWQPVQWPNGAPADGQMDFDFEEIELPEGFDFSITFSQDPNAEPNTEFYMQDKVNFFSGLTNVQ